MTIHTRMSQAADRGAARLGDAGPATAGFVAARQLADGSFADRAGDGDLYFTVFGLEAGLALGASIDLASAARMCESLGDGAGLDFVHLCSLVRCRAILGMPTDTPTAGALADTLVRHVSGDGGFAPTPDSARATAYATFLGVAAVQDLRREPDCSRLATAAAGLGTPDGGYANLPNAAPTTPTTAAIVTLLAGCDLPVPEAPLEWLAARRVSGGGFAAAAMLPVADLLSTAVARHALCQAGASIPPEVERADAEFAAGCRGPSGGFAAMPVDPAADVEYTFYGLLSDGAPEDDHAGNG